MASYLEKINNYRSKNSIKIVSIDSPLSHQPQDASYSQSSKDICPKIQSSNQSSSQIKIVLPEGDSYLKISDIPEDSQEYLSSRANQSPKATFPCNEQHVLNRDFCEQSAFHLRPQPIGTNSQHPLCKSMISAICLSENAFEDFDHSQMYPLIFSEHGDLNHNNSKDLQRVLILIKQYYSQMRKLILSDIKQIKESYMQLQDKIKKVVLKKFIQKIVQKNYEIEDLQKKVDNCMKQNELARKVLCSKCQQRQRQSRTKSKNRPKQSQQIYLKEKNIQLQAKLQDTRKTCQRLRYNLKAKENKQSQLLNDNKILVQRLKEIIQKKGSVERDLQEDSQIKLRKNSMNRRIMKKYSQNECLRESDKASVQQNRSRARSDAVKNSPERDSTLTPTVQYKQREFVENIAEEEDETVDYQFAKKSASFKVFNQDKNLGQKMEIQDIDKQIKLQANMVDNQSREKSSQATKKNLMSNALKNKTPCFKKNNSKRVQEYQDDLQQNQYDCEDKYDQNYFNNQETPHNQKKVSPNSSSSDPYSPLNRRNQKQTPWGKLNHNESCLQQQLLQSMYVFSPNFKEQDFRNQQSNRRQYPSQQKKYLKSSQLTNTYKASHIGNPQQNHFSQIHHNQSSRNHVNKTNYHNQPSSQDNRNVLRRIRQKSPHKSNMMFQPPSYSPYLRNSAFTNCNTYLQAQDNNGFIRGSSLNPNTKQKYYIAKGSYAPSAMYYDSQDRYEDEQIYKNSHFQANTNQKRQRSRENKRESPYKKNREQSHQLNLQNFGKVSVPIYQQEDRSHRERSKKHGIMKIQQKIEKLKKEFSKGSSQY